MIIVVYAMTMVIYAILYHLRNYNNGWMIIIFKDDVITVIEFYNNKTNNSYY